MNLSRATVAAGFECPPGEDGYFPDPEVCWNGDIKLFTALKEHYF